MTPEFALRKLQEAQARAQGPDEGERAIGGALVAHWSEVLRQYNLAIPRSGHQNAPESILERSGAIVAKEHETTDMTPKPEQQRINADLASLLAERTVITASPEVRRFNQAVERAERLLHDEVDRASTQRLIRLLIFPRYQQPPERFEAAVELEAAWLALPKHPHS